MILQEMSTGQHVKIRDWDDMVSEFGCICWTIGTPRYCFSRRMRYLCGSEFVVERIDENGNVILHNHPCNSTGDRWYIVPDMLEPVIPESIDTVTLQSFLEKFM